MLPFKNKRKAVTGNFDSPQPDMISRREWLERLTVPALAVAGAALPAITAQAAPVSTHHTSDQLQGARMYNVRDFGAKGDGKTLDTKAIQTAIDACHKANGGTVLIPAGDFICGTKLFDIRNLWLSGKDQFGESPH